MRTSEKNHKGQIGKKITKDTFEKKSLRTGKAVFREGFRKAFLEFLSDSRDELMLYNNLFKKLENHQRT